MSETPKSSAEDGHGFRFPMLEMPTANAQMFPNFPQMNNAFVERGGVLNKEIMRFANERAQANAKLLQSLPECTSWDKAVAVQTEFMTSTSGAFMLEMPKLVEKATEMWTSMFAPLAEAAKAEPATDKKS